MKLHCSKPEKLPVGRTGPPPPPSKSLQIECDQHLHGFMKELEACSTILQATIVEATSHIPGGVADVTAETSRSVALEKSILDEYMISVLYKSCEESVMKDYEGPRNELFGMLRSENPHRLVVSIVAMACSGKTTLARQIYHIATAEEFPCRVWLSFSPDYIGTHGGLHEIFVEMGRAIEPRKSEELSRMEETRLRDHVKGILGEKTYLVVMDNVWEANVWSMMQAYLPDVGNGSRVIVTSRCETAAPHGPFSSVFRLPALGDERNWELFSREARLGSVEGCDLLEFAGRLAREYCEGLPRELVLLGSLLARQEGSLVAWEHAVQRYQRGEEEEGRISSELLRMSYTLLPKYLQPFLLYLACFPRGRYIEVERLLQLYVAEGFAADEAAAGLHLRELEEQCVVGIVDRPVPPSRCCYGVHRYPFEENASFCRVHGRLHDIIKEEASRIGFMHFHDRNLSVVKRVALHGSGSGSGSGSVSGSDLGLGLHSAGSLQAILDFRKAGCFRSYVRFESLKVLELEGIQVRTLPDEIGTLVHLVHLGLRDSSVAYLPNSIGQMVNLQTLDMRNSYVLDLPPGVWSTMRSLRHVHCICRPSFDGAENLPELRTLDGARMGPWAKLGLLQSFPSLSKLSLFGTERFHLLSSALLPRTLVEVRLFDVTVSFELWSSLQDLPALEILHLVGCCISDAGKLACVYGGFSKLRELVLMDLVGLKTWRVEEDSMPDLRRILIVRCDELVVTPEDILNINTATEQVYVGMGEKFMKSLQNACSYRTNHGWRGSYEAPSIKTHTSNTKPIDVLFELVSMLSKVLLPAMSRHDLSKVDLAVQVINQLHQINDQMQIIFANIRDAEHSLRWSSKGDDEWAKIWEGEIKTITCISEKCFSLLQKLTFPLDVGVMSPELDRRADEITAVADALCKLKRKMGL